METPNDPLDDAAAMTGKPTGAKTPSTPSIPFRWLIETFETCNWDDRDKEWITSGWKSGPVLQWWNGTKWLTIPTVELPSTRC